MATPHDDLFHHTFQHARHAAGWLATVLPPAIANALNWSTLRPAPEKVRGRDLRQGVTDPVFVVELLGGGGSVFLLLEHKSWFDRQAHDQVLRYDVHLANCTRSSSSPANLVIAILVYHGGAPWPAEMPRHPDLRHLDPSVAAAFEKLQPRLHFVLEDLTRYTEAELRRPRLTALAQLTHLAIAHLPDADPTGALAALNRWADLLRAVDRDEGPPPGPDSTVAFAVYALKVTEIPAATLHETFERILQRPEETIMSTAEKLIRQGLERGLTQGQANAILRQMEKRFGPVSGAIAERVRSSTPEELDRLTDRILDAKTLDELLAD